MKKNLYAFCCVAFSLILSSFVLQSQTKEADKIVGVWYNDVKSAKIEIYRTTANKYLGKIIWLQKTHDDVSNLPRADDLNPDKKLRNRPLMGLIILKDLIYEGKSTWESGTIYDPKNGKTYSVKLTMTEENPNALQVRGFIGFSLIGRTSVWTKTKE